MRTAALLVPALAVLLSACGGPQSMLGGGGSSAAAIETLWWAMFWAALAIFALVLFLAAVGGWRGRRAAPGTLMVAAGGLVLPVGLLSVLLVYSVSLGERLATATERAQLRIEVEGLQWWWRVEYPGAPGAVLANEIRLPVGVQVEVELGSPDVIHSLWIPGLAGKQDMTPGRKAHLALLAEKPGVYRGQCAEFCGAQHALMALYVVAMPPTEFDSWLARQARPVPTSRTPCSGAAGGVHRGRLRRLPHRPRHAGQGATGAGPHPRRRAPEHRGRPAAGQHRRHPGLDRRRPEPQAGQPDAVLQPAERAGPECRGRLAGIAGMTAPQAAGDCAAIRTIAATPRLTTPAKASAAGTTPSVSGSASQAVFSRWPANTIPATAASGR